jgi:OOP family OmpA-OmpF porin
MKRLSPIYVFILSYFSCRAQNLVPNYSFEKYTACVTQIDEYTGGVADWTGQEGSGGLSYCTAQCPDSSNKSLSAGVPYNAVGFQHAHTGLSYTEMNTFINGSTDTVFPYGRTVYLNYRNYIEAKLIDTLKTGITYYVTFFINLADSSDYACNDIGAYFSDSTLSFNSEYAKSYLIPQVANNPIKHPLTDTMNWMKVSGSFVAKGGETYIIIGNFKNDSLSSITYLGKRSPDATAAYYYVDDVIVSADSTTSINEINASSENVNVFPNPSNGNYELRITNFKFAGI